MWGVWELKLCTLKVQNNKKFGAITYLNRFIRTFVKFIRTRRATESTNTTSSIGATSRASTRSTILRMALLIQMDDLELRILQKRRLVRPRNLYWVIVPRLEVEKQLSVVERAGCYSH